MTPRGPEQRGPGCLNRGMAHFWMRAEHRPTERRTPVVAEDAAALGEFTEQITGRSGALASAAYTVLEKLGLAEGTPADRIDLPEARTLITALAGIVDASKADLGIHAAPIRDGLKGLQLAFREASAYPDEPGEGPGEKYTGPVRAPRR